MIDLLLLNMVKSCFVVVVDRNVESELVPISILVALILCDLSSAPASNETTMNGVVISDQGIRIRRL